MNCHQSEAKMFRAKSCSEKSGLWKLSSIKNLFYNLFSVSIICSLFFPSLLQVFILLRVPIALPLL